MSKKFDLSTLTSSQLVAAYNSLSGREIKKFSDRATGEKRLQMLLDEHDSTIRIESDEVVVYKNDAAPAAPRKPRTDYTDDLRIEVRVSQNPKRAGTKAHARFALYRDGMTVAEYKAACTAHDGKHARPGFRYLGDLKWDEERQYVMVWDLDSLAQFDADAGGPGKNKALDPYRPTK